MFSELFSTRGDNPTWRWGTWISLIYNAVTLVGLALFYFPHAHTRAEGMGFAAVAKRIDYVGGALSIIGLTLFLVALQAGGYTHPWSSAYILCTLLFGLALLITWVVWEWKFAKHPMIPKELFLGQRVVGFAFAVAFVAGMNFFSLLNFWPLTISTVWSPDPVSIGWRGLPVGLATAVGAVFWTALLSVWKGGLRWILFMASLMLTAFGGSLASMTPDNVYQSVTLASLAAFGLGGVIVPAATVAMIVRIEDYTAGVRTDSFPGLSRCTHHDMCSSVPVYPCCGRSHWLFNLLQRLRQEAHCDTSRASRTGKLTTVPLTYCRRLTVAVRRPSWPPSYQRRGFRWHILDCARAGSVGPRRHSCCRRTSCVWCTVGLC